MSLSHTRDEVEEHQYILANCPREQKGERRWGRFCQGNISKQNVIMKATSSPRFLGARLIMKDSDVRFSVNERRNAGNEVGTLISLLDQGFKSARASDASNLVPRASFRF